MSPAKESHTLIYPSHQIDPEDILNFWELDWFFESWSDLGLTDEDLSALQVLIMSDPGAAPVMEGTHSLRKLRFSPEGWNTGKSHAIRVCYVHFRKYGHVLLCLAFRKGVLDNISAKGKKAINRAIDRIEQRMKTKFGF